MTYMPMSSMLRSEIRAHLGSIALTAAQEHMYYKALDYFDPRADWQTTDILELSELAHRLRGFAETLKPTHPAKMEATRLAKTIWNDYAEVYKVAMKRAIVSGTSAA